MAKKTKKKTVAEILAECKSTTVITDPAEIAKFLADRKKDQSKASERSSTIIRSQKDSDGHMIQKLSEFITDPGEIPPADELKRLAEARGIRWDEGMEERVIPTWASDERPDRDGDIVQQVWRLENFVKNPLVLFSHRWHMPAIGMTLSEKVAMRVEEDYTGPALWAMGVFATREVSAFADDTFKLIKAGFLKMVSVGFFPGTVTRVDDEAERARLGLGRWGAILGNNELIEWSPVPVPANPGAHMILESAKAAGHVEASTYKSVAEWTRRGLYEEDAGEQWAKAFGDLQSTWGKLFPDHVVCDHSDVEEEFQDDEIVRRNIWVGFSEQFKDEDPTEPTEPADDEPTDEKGLKGSLEAISKQNQDLKDELTEVKTILEGVEETVEGLKEAAEEAKLEPVEDPEPKGETIDIGIFNELADTFS